MSQHLWWYVARSGGIVAWGLVTASVLWGLFLSTKALGRRPRPSWLLDLHRFLGGLALVFTGIHVAALVLDSYSSFGLVQIFVPFTSHYRASAVAWGVVGLYLLVAVEVTSLLRSRIPKALWRRIHLASFPLFLVSTLHGLQAGTDASSPLLRWAMVGAMAAVSGFTGLRVVQATIEPAAVPRIPVSARPTAAVTPPVLGRDPRPPVLVGAPASGQDAYPPPTGTGWPPRPPSTDAPPG